MLRSWLVCRVAVAFHLRLVSLALFWPWPCATSDPSRRHGSECPRSAREHALEPHRTPSLLSPLGPCLAAPCLGFPSVSVCTNSVHHCTSKLVPSCALRPRSRCRRCLTSPPPPWPRHACVARERVHWRSRLGLCPSSPPSPRPRLARSRARRSAP